MIRIPPQASDLLLPGNALNHPDVQNFPRCPTHYTYTHPAKRNPAGHVLTNVRRPCAYCTRINNHVLPSMQTHQKYGWKVHSYLTAVHVLFQMSVTSATIHSLPQRKNVAVACVLRSPHPDTCSSNRALPCTFSLLLREALLPHCVLLPPTPCLLLPSVFAAPG